MSLISLEEAGIVIPKAGWPGRRRAQLRAALYVVVAFLVAGLLLVGFLGLILLTWAATLPAPR